MPRFNLDDYVSVQDRINKFWEDYPEGRIDSHLVAFTPDHRDVIVQANIYTNIEHAVPTATGMAQETAGTGGANNGCWLENCETSAIGRALANLGFATSAADRMSREEADKVNRLDEHSPAPAAAPAAAAPASRPHSSNRTAAPAAASADQRTDGQGKMLYRLRMNTGFNEAQDWENWLADNFGVSNDRQLTKTQASLAITGLQILAGEDVEDRALAAWESRNPPF